MRFSRNNSNKRHYRAGACPFRFVVTVLAFALGISVGFAFVDAISISHCWRTLLIRVSCNLVFVIGMLGGYVIGKPRERELVELSAILKDEPRGCWQGKLRAALRKLRKTRAMGPLIGALQSGSSCVQQNGPWLIERINGCLSFLLILLGCALSVVICVALFDQKNVLWDLERIFLRLPSPFIIFFLGVAVGYYCQELREEEHRECIAALKNEHWYVRKAAALRLGRMKDRRAVEPLIFALTDKNAAVRAESAKALGRLKARRTVEVLIKLLQDEIWFVRRSAAEALGNTKDALALDPLVAALNDENPQVRSEAAKALGGLNDSKGIVPLVAALNDQNSHVRQNAATALKEIVTSAGVIKA